jgi:hypothetical protein
MKRSKINRTKNMSKYKVKQAFSYTDQKAPNPPQEISYEAGAEVELDDEKAAEIGLSYLEKIEGDSSEPAPQPESPAGGEAEGSESRQDASPEGEGGDKGQE